MSSFLNKGGEITWYMDWLDNGKRVTAQMPHTGRNEGGEDTGPEGATPERVI
jgi:hypothetical protein